MPTPRFGEALAYANELHAEQTRKGTDIPYISHLMAVSALVWELGGDEDMAIAGLLHDAVEDQGGPERAAEIEAKFGVRVARMVLDCTDAVTIPKPDWKTRKQAYVDAIARKAEDSLTVTLADKIHNAQAITDDRVRVGEAVWLRFSQPRAEVVWYYQALAQAIGQRLPGAGAQRLQDMAAGFGSGPGSGPISGHIS